MILDLEKIKARWVSATNDAQSAISASDVPALVAEVERLREELRVEREANDCAAEMIRADASRLGRGDERGDWCSQWIAANDARRKA